MTEHDFLEQYDSNSYDKPSVTVDVLIFAMNENYQLEVLLVRRSEHPFLNCYAVPGGFVRMQESLEEAAWRKLKEETGLEHIYLEQLCTFGKVHRDPRMRVISVAYMALLAKAKLSLLDTAKAAKSEWFIVSYEQGKLQLKKKEYILEEKEIAFDHAEMIKIGIERLRGKLEYTDIAFSLLEDKNRFSIYELQKIYETVQGKTLDVANFRRFFQNRYVALGKAEKTQEKCYAYSKRPSYYYQLKIPDGISKGTKDLLPQHKN